MIGHLCLFDLLILWIDKNGLKPSNGSRKLIIHKEGVRYPSDSDHNSSTISHMICLITNKSNYQLLRIMTNIPTLSYVCQEWHLWIEAIGFIGELTNFRMLLEILTLTTKIGCISLGYDRDLIIHKGVKPYKDNMVCPMETWILSSFLGVILNHSTF